MELYQKCLWLQYVQKSSDSECSCGHPDLSHKGQGFAREKAICEKEEVFISAFRISLTEREKSFVVT